MRVEAVFLPDHLETMRGRVAVVIDVLRRTTTALALLKAGADDVLLAGNLDEARQLKAASGALPVGEEVGRTSPAPGCDFGPSPVALQSHDLRGRRVAPCTTNGTVAAFRAPEAAAPTVYMACLANVTAVATATLADSERGDANLVIVCAGLRGGRRARRGGSA
jgi:2-phosphosulfolactate phosphatase